MSLLVPEVGHRYGRWWAFLPAHDRSWRVWVPVDSEADGRDVVEQWRAFRASWDGSLAADCSSCAVSELTCLLGRRPDGDPCCSGCNHHHEECP
ncbi:hypothetical protein [Actinomycetospora aeridis]|uniref:Uncharacterized protein n=1 Tax=Actinomycetospora aeridis TaxID=3129231 RepID=A0ABU8N405_9PSEU